MLSPEINKFLTEIISYVKFKFDRDNIRRELENHILDKIEDYIDQGYDEETAEQLSIHNMGDAKEIGMELNKQHNPIIGWIWRITNSIAMFTVTIFGLFCILFMSSLFQGSLINDIPKSNIVYKLDLNEKVRMDDRVIHFTNVVYEKNGNMNIFYKTYYVGLRGSGWSIGFLGEITDNLDNKYMSRSGQEKGGVVHKGVWTIDHFSEDATMLIISYDMYNRNFKVEIPLKEGEYNE